MDTGSSNEHLISTGSSDEHEPEHEITSASSNVSPTNRPEPHKDDTTDSEIHDKPADEEESEGATSAKDTDTGVPLPAKGAGYKLLKNQGDDLSAMKRIKKSKQPTSTSSYSDDSPSKDFKSRSDDLQSESPAGSAPCAPPSSPSLMSSKVLKNSQDVFKSFCDGNDEISITRDDGKPLIMAIEALLNLKLPCEFMLFEDIDSSNLYEMVETLKVAPNEQGQLKLSSDIFGQLIRSPVPVRICTHKMFGEWCSESKTLDSKNDPEKTDMITKAQLRKVLDIFSKNAHIGSKVKTLMDHTKSQKIIEYSKLRDDIWDCFNESSERSQSENEQNQSSSSPQNKS